MILLFSFVTHLYSFSQATVQYCSATCFSISENQSELIAPVNMSATGDTAKKALDSLRDQCGEDGILLKRVFQGTYVNPNPVIVNENTYEIIQTGWWYDRSVRKIRRYKSYTLTQPTLHAIIEMREVTEKNACRNARPNEIPQTNVFDGDIVL